MTIKIQDAFLKLVIASFFFKKKDVINKKR